MADTNDMLEHRIRERAFQLWQEAGCPEGRAEAFWQEAQEVETNAEKPSQTEDIVEAAGGHYPPTGDTQNFA